MHTHSLAALALAAALTSTPALAAERANAQIVDRAGATVGTATLTESPHGVLIHVAAKGLPPGPKAIHIHSVGTCDDGAAGFVASKGHLNPATRPHGLMNPEGPDAGAVLEKNYPQGSGGKYVPCGAGSIKNNTRQSVADIAAEIENPLPFGVEKDSPDPQILIMHTHATEDYRLSAGLWYSPGDGARTTDTNLNMCAVGRVMADTLNAAGLNTLHDETLNDYPSYTGSYANSRAVVQRYLAQYPSIKVVLDVHRDAIETEGGSRMAPVCTVDGRQAAQVMIICGCDNGGSVQLPNWRQNLRFAAAWERSMEGMYPGFTRPVLFSYRFYNQDLTTGSLLIEIGGHGNNLNEALYAGQLAANGLVQALLGPDA